MAPAGGSPPRGDPSMEFSGYGTSMCTPQETTVSAPRGNLGKGIDVWSSRIVGQRGRISKGKTPEV
jgi:hypothetical protein